MNKNLFKYDGFKRTQHMAVRNTVGWYDFTHQLVEVSGPDAVAVLDRIHKQHRWHEGGQGKVRVHAQRAGPDYR